MDQDLWRELPLEIFIDILLRLSLRNITTCKCVCKPWHDLIESDDFLKLGLSKSAPALVVSMLSRDSNWFSVFKLDDSIPVTASNCFHFSKLEAKHKHDPITKFNFPQTSSILSSANGLLLLEGFLNDNPLYVCNPITREFVEILGPRSPQYPVCYGLGVSKIRGRYKVVLFDPIYGCRVLTLASRSSWRHVIFNLSFDHCHRSSGGGVFINGNLYWLVSKNEEIPYICCFDVETERFSTFPAPVNSVRSDDIECGLCSLGDSLCFCDDGLYENEIWEYEQVEKRWSKLPFIMEQTYIGVFSMCGHPGIGLKYPPPQHKQGNTYFKPIRVYRNGDMLMLWHGDHFLYYSYKWRSVKEIGLFGGKHDRCFALSSILLTPSLLSLKKDLGMENVISL